jgi:hypothetical protein
LDTARFEHGWVFLGNNHLKHDEKLRKAAATEGRLNGNSYVMRAQQLAKEQTRSDLARTKIL